ncbi:NADP-dependent oxidoreductase [Saccharothrix coeruleofusca]|uniref:NADP-dependent oxidoreductase n=1 Tax=Saccharothrix coeruleofusca TaxID=33919 RepID=A0A918EEN9_9PSEU|nr:NADP-dependent oxidoreductase [Saccharothrix coeruleofusca]GGP67305.1 NADP-dependent oxidoreductase [Saccharothrix coeruleofusca]
MRSQVNRQIVLAARPHGNPKESDFEIVERPVPVPGDGQVLVRNLLVSLDPFNRILMGNANSDQAPIELGETMFGFTVGVVERSDDPAFAVGDHVVGFTGTTGWQDYAVSDGSDLRVVDPDAVPLSAHLGVLGVTGLTAWVGLTEVLDPEPGGTLVVTAAAGAVGSAAAQLGKLRGHRVVGIAGGPEKTRHLLDDLGLDAAADHRAPDFAERLARAVPDGIDTVYENVGAALFPALVPHLNRGARIAVGGVMSQITRTGAFEGPDHLPDLLRAALYKTLTIRGFDVTEFYDRYPRFLAELTPAVVEGKLHHSAHVVEGLEAIPAAFPRMFTGQVAGKMIAEIG